MWLDKFLVSVFTVYSSFVGLNIFCIVHLYLGGLVVLWIFSRFKIVFKGNEEFFWRNVCFLIKCRKKYVQKKIYDSYFYCILTGNIKHVGIYNDFTQSNQRIFYQAHKRCPHHLAVSKLGKTFAKSCVLFITNTEIRIIFHRSRTKKLLVIIGSLGGGMYTMR